LTETKPEHGRRRRVRFYVNIDHVATIRQARGTDEPDPVRAAVLVELAGADGITVHLREDRRHIQDRDVRLLMETVRTGVNLEMGATDEMVGIATELMPMQVTLVPEKRQELTTEGGLALTAGAAKDAVASAIDTLGNEGLRVALFIDPDPASIQAARELGADAVELHTGEYANHRRADRQRQLERLRTGARLAREHDLDVHAGHGLTYENIHPIAAIPEVEELSIGHSIVSRAVLVGLERAVAEMRDLIDTVAVH
jgi:pyridoxine 5-phosphate synthase